MNVLDEIRFMLIAQEESKRTVICPPSDADRIRRLVEQVGAGHVVTVTPSPFVPDGTAFLVDESAIEAGSRESLQHQMKAGLWP